MNDSITLSASIVYEANRSKCNKRAYENLQPETKALYLAEYDKFKGGRIVLPWNLVGSVSWIPNQSHFSASDRLLSLLDFWISGDRQITMRFDVRHQCYVEISARSLIEPVKYKSDVHPIEQIMGRMSEHIWHGTHMTHVWNIPGWIHHSCLNVPYTFLQFGSKCLTVPLIAYTYL